MLVAVVEVLEQLAQIMSIQLPVEMVVVVLHQLLLVLA
jgi:hypothetical protein